MRPRKTEVGNAWLQVRWYTDAGISEDFDDMLPPYDQDVVEAFFAGMPYPPCASLTFLRGLRALIIPSSPEALGILRKQYGGDNVGYHPTWAG